MRRGHYNPTSDAVWLAAFVPANVRTMLDVGIGSGGVSLCAQSHSPNLEITGLDVSDEMLIACTENMQLNNVNIKLLNQDILTWKTTSTYDVVVSNPPYFKGTPARHNAHHNVDLVAWCRACLRRVRPQGWFCTIVDAGALADVVSVMNKVCGDINIMPLYGAKMVAERVLIRGRVGSKAPTILHQGLKMNYEPVLRDGLTIAKALGTLGQQ